MKGAVVHSYHFLFVWSHCALIGKMLAEFLMTQCQVPTLSPKSFHKNIYSKLDFCTEQENKHFTPLFKKKKFLALKPLPWVDPQYSVLTMCLKISSNFMIKFKKFIYAFN